MLLRLQDFSMLATVTGYFNVSDGYISTTGVNKKGSRAGISSLARVFDKQQITSRHP